VNKYLKELPTELQKKLKKKKMPTFEQPMLATLTKNYFNDAGWIFERKFDGVRCLIFKDGAKVNLKSRNRNSMNKSYPELLDPIKDLAPSQLILDGEIVAFKGNYTSFEKLQSRIGLASAQKARATRVKIYIYIFDILYFDGYDLTKLPLITRKTILKKAVRLSGALRYTVHINEHGADYFPQACSKKWEGLIAKKRDGVYEHKRSRNWLKFKCVANQELVIAGYTDPAGSRTGFGALLMGYYKNGALHFAGKVGTGFSTQFLQEFGKKLQKIEITKNPFSSHNLKRSNLDTIHFVKPIYVAEIGFEEWTRDNKLRQPRFLGLRPDKKAKDVVKEEPR
jgi:bifunctional non-homologous end joining protein LigD